VSRRANANAAALLVASTLVVPSLGWAGSGGAGLPGSNGGGPGASTGRGTSVQPGDITVSATSDGITLATRVSALLRDQLRFTGSIAQSNAGRTVVVERLGRRNGWQPTASAITAGDGSFTAIWRTNHTGRFAIRAIVQRAGLANRSAATGSPTLTVTVYRPSIATQYGTGFYDQTTACGEILKPNTLGVAHRTLPCGTPIAIYFHGRTIVVPVIDRGPYANNANWDVTEATGRALGMQGTETIGAVSLPSPQ
jgi:rare lipoprotein A